MSTDLVPLAFLMFAVTYPSRAIGLLAPGDRRLPRARWTISSSSARPSSPRSPRSRSWSSTSGGRSAFTIGLPWLSVARLHRRSSHGGGTCSSVWPLPSRSRSRAGRPA